MFVLNPSQLEANLGGSAKSALDAARQLAQGSGLKGIYFVASTDGSPAQEAQLLADDYDALSSYSYGTAGVFGPTGYIAPDPDEAPYSLMITGYESIWDMLIAASTVPYLIPTGTDWDPRPDKPFQYGGYAPFVRTGATAAQYQTMLQAAKQRIDSGEAPPIVMVDAWNEHGEGHWSEPSAGFGFSYLDVIRSVFVSDSPHTDLVPADVGLPLVQTAPSPALWTFTDPSDLVPWQVSPGPPFSSAIYNVSNSQISGNQWTFTTGPEGSDVEVDRASFELSALDYSALTSSLSVSADLYLNIYWGAEDEPGPSVVRNIGFTATAGGAHTYTFTLAGLPGWRGLINSLRITFYGPSNTNVAIQSIQFIPSSAADNIAVSKPQLQFTWTLGAQPPASQTVSVAGATGASLSWTAGSNASWLSLGVSGGAVPGNLPVTIKPAGLAAGVYNTTIAISSNPAANSPLTIPVSLWVLPAAVAPVDACDVNKDQVVNIADVQSMINEALGVTAAANDLNGDGVVNVVDLQIVIAATLGGICTAQ